MNGFQQRREEKKKDILDAAYQLFNEHGIDNVKITDIAEKANVSKVSIYNYFGSKDELIKLVLFDIMDKSIAEFRELMTSEVSFNEKFEMMYHMSMSVGSSINEGFLDFFVASSPIIQEYMGTYYEKNIKPFFVDLIEQGKEEGAIDSELSTESLLLYLEAFKFVLSKPIDFKQRIDLGKLFYFGFTGKSSSDPSTKE